MYRIWGSRERINTKGRQWDVVKRWVGRRVGREIGQDLQIGLDLGDGLEDVYKMIRGSLTGSKTNIADVRANTASTVRLLTHVLCKPTHFFFHSFIATMSYSP